MCINYMYLNKVTTSINWWLYTKQLSFFPEQCIIINEYGTVFKNSISTTLTKPFLLSQ